VISLERPVEVKARVELKKHIGTNYFYSDYVSIIVIGKLSFGGGSEETEYHQDIVSDDDEIIVFLSS